MPAEDFGSLPRYASVKDDGLAAIGTIEPLHALRTTFVHGLYNGKKVADRYVFGLLEGPKGGPGFVETHTFAREELTGLAEAMEKARVHMESILLRMRQSPP